MKKWTFTLMVLLLGTILVGCNSKTAPPAQEAVPEAEMPSPEEMDTTGAASPAP